MLLSTNHKNGNATSPFGPVVRDAISFKRYFFIFKETGKPWQKKAGAICLLKIYIYMIS